jgi:hypothetical protein
MLDYIAVVKYGADGKVEKYQDFDSKSECDAHVVTFGGFVAPKPDSDRTRYWVVDADESGKKTLTYDKATADSDDAAIAAVAYKDVRRAAYPDLGEQMDMQYHDLVDGTTKWKDAVAKVKSDNPKP